MLLYMNEIYTKDFDKWNECQKTLDKQEFEGFCREREVWWCALGVNIGSEQDGKNDDFERPMLIVKKINDELLLTIPFTSKLIKNRYRIDVKSTGQNSQAILSQFRTISSRRLLKRIGYVKTDTFNIIIVKSVMMLLESIQSKTPS
jgi:mRNA-degrading endonuclease toxin of MazEF toxin-antitoxin module